MSRKTEMILLDLDGTLVDSVPELAHCVDLMCARLGLAPRGEARVREWIGNGVERMVRRALVNDVVGEPDEALFQQAYPIFIDLYAEHIGTRTVVYPGVRDGLDYLSAAGYKLGCVTNKQARFTEPLLRDLGLADYFGIVVSGDTLPQKKPEPEPLLHAAEHFGVRPEHAVMVGDSVSDVTAARAAGFRVFCLTYGYNHGRDIREANPDAVMDSLVEIRGLLERAA